MAIYAIVQEMSIKEHPPQHVPVLLDATLRVLRPQLGESYLDLTAGYGGHAGAILERSENYRASCLVDRDDTAIRALQPLAVKGVRLIHDDFVAAAQQLAEENASFDMILVDLGVSSPQLDRAARGFSFKRDGPLDMRMDGRQQQTAASFVNSVSETELADCIRRYGEERPGVAKRYARAIVAGRPFTTTGQLAQVILEAHVGPRQKTHPATRTFQAIRMVINQELEQIEALLPLLPKLLHHGGRVGVISFHSLEDRLVKRFFSEEQSAGFEAELEILTKKPISGTEDAHNPRARSAKLRAAVKK